MNANELIKQTAQATEEYLIGWLKLDDKPLDDLKALAVHVHLDEWEPGELAVNILDLSIKIFGADISDDLNYDVFGGKLNDGDLPALQYWIDSLGEGDLLLLDQVLWQEMEEKE